MVANKIMQNKSVIKESGRLKDMLLDVQVQVDAVAREAEATLLRGSQRKLGYNQLNVGNDKELIDSRVSTKTPVLTPHMLSTVLPVSENSASVTDASRKAIIDIIKHKDKRLIVVVGPCSIHDPLGAIEYAHHVQKWRLKHGDNLEIIMRAYMEKPRTELGWKGFIYDPLLDGSDDINLGLVATRMLACQITDLGVPIAMERLNALTPQYVNALVAYDTIGARNTTDQKSREYASATSSPVGFKNTPEGSIEVAAEAMVSARGGHTFLGMGMNGVPAQIASKGNDTAHIILRGDQHGPNYSATHIAKTREMLHRKKLPESIVVDVSHGNSGKKAARQINVILDLCQQIINGESIICGVMIESNLVGGAQKLVSPKDLIYGQSITDECVDIQETETMLAHLARAAQKR